MAQLELIEAIERRLWSAADTLRANSTYASNEYFLPVMGLVFLRHAYSRYLAVKDDIVANLPTRGGKVRPLTKDDFSQRSAIFLQTSAQFDTLVALTSSDDRAKAIIEAMESIEADYESLKGALPKAEYHELDNEVLGHLLRTLNPEELKQVKGDVFGRIYEYFLTQFAGEKAHDGGEFFTPISLVSLIANVLEPSHGTVLDPACGSGGMFVQSARVVERQHQNPSEKLTFRGLEKNATTIRLAKMNLAVHGLEGDIQKAISYYEDPHELLGKAHYVMANPPFNVDEIDADKIKTDPRLPFGLPGVNTKSKVSNGNYIWISYFYSYLNEKGRAGFVMSSQASSAGRDEASVRQQLVKTGHVDAMIGIRSNFFYTRTVPCELWFLDKAKPEKYIDNVLMIDARNIYRQVTRKIYDFSPEQEQNILAIMWLYRGQIDKYLSLLTYYCQQTINFAQECVENQSVESEQAPLPAFASSLTRVFNEIKAFLNTLKADSLYATMAAEYNKNKALFEKNIDSFRNEVQRYQKKWNTLSTQSRAMSNEELKKTIESFPSLVGSSKSLIIEIEDLYKNITKLIELCEKECDARKHDAWSSKKITKARKEADTLRQLSVEKLKNIEYMHAHALWLSSRFPDAKLCDVEGLVKLVSRAEIEANDWSLTPGRYVGVSPDEIDEEFDFKESLRTIHDELNTLNEEAITLASTIKKNFEELGL